MSSAFSLLSPATKDRAQKTRVAHGAEGEAAVAAMAEQCALAGLGVLKKRPTNVTVIRGRRVHLAAAGVDFHGHLRGGRAVYIEAKFCSSGRLALDMLREPQRQELARAARDGALAVVVVLFGDTPALARTYAVPWAIVADAIDRCERQVTVVNGKRKAKVGTASLNEDRLGDWRVRGLLLQAKAFGGDR